MRINTKTMLWEEIPPETQAHMLAITDAIVFDGKVPYPFPPWLALWFDTFGHDKDQSFVLLTTAIPPRVYRSLLNCKSDTKK